MQVVWFKRDLRTNDHRPLVEAAKRGPTMGLYLYEPSLFRARDFDPSHLIFINESLDDLRRNLAEIGAMLVIRRAEAVEAFKKLHRELRIDGLWSHEETGTLLTYARDRAVKLWADEAGVPWKEFPQNGVVRRLKSREGWANRWRKRMTARILSPPGGIVSPCLADHGPILSLRDLGLPPSARTDVQTGGEGQARKTLDDFLSARGVNYRKDMSSPVSAETGCSRISPYLAWGNISLRQVFQSSQRRRAEVQELLQEGADVDRRWTASLASFNSRLRWHCHFMQKLEDQPDLEQTNMCRAYDGLRENEFDDDLFEAWRAGRTGYPMVDACMRALHQTGWINFRMRAMLVSFACYHLWLHWKPVADELSRLFLDYEPGIHYAQTQMQAGVTGINTIRIYSPIKQILDQDPHGVFLKRWLPELQGVPESRLAEPHKMTADEQRRAGCAIGKDYPAPIVDHASAYKAARKRMYSLKGRAETRREAEKVYRKHGSRKRPRRREED